MPSIRPRLLIAGVLAAAVATTAAVSVPGAASAAPKSATTSAAEKRRLDRLPTPKLGWYKCYQIAECATVKVPLDYDKPKGAKTELAVVRVKAKDQKRKIGSLFVNPGGPGGSAAQFALFAPDFLSDPVLERFDVVGVDPRGIGFSANIKCFKSVKQQTAVFNKMNVAFPLGSAEEKRYIAGAKAFGKACSTTGKTLAGAMSTAEVARDMELMRRAVGDKKLTYLGFSYGTALGQYYANLFPDRFRAIAVDGNIDPRQWVGAGSSGNRILDARMHSAEGASRALREILIRCDKAGEEYCAFAAGNPVANYAAIARKLRAKPLVVTDEFGTFKITYADFVGASLSYLYSTYAGEMVTQLAAEVAALQAGGTAAAAAEVSLRKRVQAAKEIGYDFPYDNSFEAQSAVICTDGKHPKNANGWPVATASRDLQAPYFGRIWGWLSVQCASGTWTVRDEDAYRGPFNKRTKATVLVVGNYWDPATNYAASVSSSRLLPNSRLVTSDNWGHTAYGTGVCATAAVDRYLLTGKVPAKGTVCKAVHQPFTEKLGTGEDPGEELSIKSAVTPGKTLPPVVAPKPVSVLTGGR
ncbi:peptidase [Actinoplanes lobatus]|uniref:Peptidase n=1 Tax=Actinoplanes lobatus TaxID=113568 RepID=A0A7W7H9F9_9ACTN|nr:alpha/beta hydrolase [Actinoplanes lobatus]MBB4746455.1 pimeloyl-ACP methyl ester carboxylesterase [Actinoplanes lobatus]GGN52558.1 peptidase [Actinoplanes lobatus]GIE45027.1 peptidase [Actinoplanes lobatus]